MKKIAKFHKVSFDELKKDWKGEFPEAKEEEIKAVYEELKHRGREAAYIDRDSSTFRKGLTVTTFYLAKGLEFDQVFAVCPGREDALAKQARYICATRALHELYMYEIK